MGSQSKKGQESPVLTDNHIELFANQKGGVGKTTLCALFANYLDNKNVPLLVLDADIQQTLKDRRDDDLKQLKQNYSEEEVSKMVHYNIRSVTISNQKNTHNIMEFLKNQKATIIIDTPGNLTQDGFVELIASTDYIICPYHYDMNTLRSTRAFALTVLRLKQSYPKIKARLLFVCNNHEKNVGKSDELQVFKKIDDYFQKSGIIVPRIFHRAKIPRSNTLRNSKDVDKMLRPCFESLFETIYTNKETDHGNV